MPLADTSVWLDALAASGHLQRLGWVVLHSLWQAAAVAAVLAVALWLLPRRSACGQEARYLLAALALFSLPVCCGITWTLVEPPRGKPAARVLRVHRPAPAAVVAAETLAAADRGLGGPSAAEAFRTLATHASSAAEPWLPLCGSLWLAGVVFAAVRLAMGWSLTRRLVATAAELRDAHWHTRLTRWKTAFGIAAPIRLLASARVDVPIVVGWLRPVVIWPAAAVTGMPPEQIDAILAHELAHVRRHDVLVNFVQSVIEAVFFHHPAAWWISAQVRAEREHCADELAIRALAAGRAGSRISYATALLSLEEQRQAILAAAANGGSLGDRIRRLSGIEQSRGQPARLAAAAIVIVAIAATLATPPDGTAGRAVADEPAARDQAPPANAVAQNTFKIESLTPEQARKLVAEFPGVRIKFHVHDLHLTNNLRFGEGLPLDSLRTLDAATAERLAEYGKAGPLSLNRLATLDADTARALAKFKGPALSLNGLTTLTADVAKPLADFQGSILVLQGLKSLDVSTAAALATFKGQQLFLKLPTLAPEAAQALAEFRGVTLSLGGLPTVDGETAEALAGFKGGELCLPSLRSLGATAAKMLAEATSWDGRLWNLTRLDAATAQAVVKNRNWDGNLPGCTVDEAAAKILATYAGDGLGFKLSRLSADTAGALAGFRGRALAIQGLTRIDPDALQALAAFQGSKLHVGLAHGFDSLPADSVRALAGCKAWDGHLCLKKMDTAVAQALVEGVAWDGRADFYSIDEATAQVLARYKGDALAVYVESLSPDTARALADFAGQKLELRGIKRLDAASASALAGFKGRQLELDLTKFDAATATALAAFEGQQVLLRSLAAVDDDTASALADLPGHSLAMPQIVAKIGAEIPLTPATARLVCAAGTAAELPRVTAIDSPDAIKIATALAAVKGPLSLPNLRKISPKTLAALIEKEDVRIPPIETLELIPEPDGSLTEDFVIPEGFQQRQQR